MKREDYKAVKHMNRAELEAYLKRIYERGYKDGVKAMATQFQQSDTAPDAAATAPEV